MNLDDFKRDFDEKLALMSNEELVQSFKDLGIYEYELPTLRNRYMDWKDIKLAEYKFVMTSLLNDLPMNRDWLDPMLEKAMRSLVEND
jgi:hypothetical protein